MNFTGKMKLTEIVNSSTCNQSEQVSWCLLSVIMRYSKCGTKISRTRVESGRRFHSHSGSSGPDHAALVFDLGLVVSKSVPRSSADFQSTLRIVCSKISSCLAQCTPTSRLGWLRTSAMISRNSTQKPRLRLLMTILRPFQSTPAWLTVSQGPDIKGAGASLLHLSVRVQISMHIILTIFYGI